MTPFKTEIETQVRALLKASSDFDDIVALVRGIAFLVPTQWYPLAEIVVDAERENESAHQTQVHEYEHDGVIYFSDQYPDHPALSNREVDVDSHDRVAVWAQAAVLLLNGEQTLGDLVSGDGKQKVWRVDVAAPKYAIAPSRGRPNNLDAQAAVEFTVYSRRQLW